MVGMVEIFDIFDTDYTVEPVDLYDIVAKVKSSY